MPPRMLARYSAGSSGPLGRMPRDTAMMESIIWPVGDAAVMNDRSTLRRSGSDPHIVSGGAPGSNRRAPFVPLHS